MNVHVNSPSSSASFIAIAYSPLIKQCSSYVSGRDGPAASCRRAIHLPSDAVGGPKCFVISKMVRDAFCCPPPSLASFNLCSLPLDLQLIEVIASVSCHQDSTNCSF